MPPPTTTPLTDPNKNLLPPVEAPPVPDPVQATEASRNLAENRELMPTKSEPIDMLKPEPLTNDIDTLETVSGQLKKLLSSDSPYLEQGRQEALRFASSRGMQNTTLAAQAGVEGRTRAALPIAQQDASTYNERATLNQNTVNQFRAAEVDHVNRLIQTAQQGDINSRLQMEQFGFNSKLSAQENLQRMEELAFQGDLQAKQSYLNYAYTTLLNDQESGLAIALEDTRFQNSQKLLEQEFTNALGLTAADAENRLNELNQQHANTLEEIAARSESTTGERGAEFTMQLQANYLAQVAARQQAASEEIRLIYQTEGLSSAQQRAGVQSAQRRYEDDIAMLQAYYSASPQWDDDFDFHTASDAIGGPGDGGMPPSSIPGGPIGPGGGGGGGGPGGGGRRRTGERRLMA